MACIAVLRFASINFECILTSIIFSQIFGNSGRESNPPFQPTIRLSPKIVSGDQPSTVSVIKPNTLSLFILRKVEFHVSILQETYRLQGRNPSFESFLILYLYYIKSGPKSQVFIKGLYSFCNFPFIKNSQATY